MRCRSPRTSSRSVSGGIAVLTLGIVLCLLSDWAGDVSAFDFSRYIPRTIAQLIGEHPAQAGLVTSPDIPIRSKVRYSGEFRPLPDDRRRLIVAWAETMNVPATPQVFRLELKINEAGREYWVPVQEVLVPVMRAELKPQEEIELFLIYIGQFNGRHVLLVNAFNHEGAHRP